MPCHFSAIFFINTIADGCIICSFADDCLGNVRQLTMLFWQNIETDLPVQAAYQPVEAGNFYFITGTLAVIGGNYLAPTVRS